MARGGAWIGEAIGSARCRDARRQAGLTGRRPGQSARRCKRATVDPRHRADDFSLCGGDFYAAGHMRTLRRRWSALDPARSCIARVRRDARGRRDGRSAPTCATCMRAGDARIKITERRAARTGAAAMVRGPGRRHRRYAVCRGSVATSQAPRPRRRPRRRLAARYHAASVVATPPAAPVPDAATPTAPAPTPADAPRTMRHQPDRRPATAGSQFTEPDGRFLSQAYVVGGSSKTCDASPAR